MAFRELKPLSLKDSLNQLTDRSQNCTLTLRPCLCLSVALKQTFAEITATKSFGKKSFSRTHNDQYGRLTIENSFPLIHKRYKLRESIGNGTFSQIFTAEDQINNKRTVAIKILRSGYDVLGHREVLFLNHLSTKAKLGVLNFVEVSEVLKFDDHVCIVMPVYQATLLDFVQLPVTVASTVAQSTLGYSKQGSNATKDPNIVHPRFVRPAGVQPSMDKLKQIQPHRFDIKLSPCNASGIPENISLGHSFPHTISKRDLRHFKRVALSLLSALCSLRQEGAIHADIKLENCFVQCEKKAPQATDFQPRPINKCSAYEHEVTSVLQRRPRFLRDLPDDFEVKLGDFGNSIHVSEVDQYYNDFNIQSLPYRAPEVLFGTPFGYQIDVWSVGVVLFELLTGKPLFLVHSGEELCQQISEKIGPLSILRFSGGKFSGLLDYATVSTDSRIMHSAAETKTNRHSNSSCIISPSNVPYIRQLLSKQLELSPAMSLESQGISSTLISFISGLLCHDPDQRLSPFDALRHSFLETAIPIPRCLFVAPGNSGGGATTNFSSSKSASLRCSAQSLRSKSLQRSEYFIPLFPSAIAASGTFAAPAAQAEGSSHHSSSSLSAVPHHQPSPHSHSSIVLSRSPYEHGSGSLLTNLSSPLRARQAPISAGSREYGSSGGRRTRDAPSAGNLLGTVMQAIDGGKAETKGSDCKSASLESSSSNTTTTNNNNSNKRRKRIVIDYDEDYEEEEDDYV